MIQVKNVSKKYGNFYAVKDISFEIKEGEIVGFLGKNGAGKSTTMNMITGFIEPTEGDIIVGGYDISRKPNKVKKLIGYMPEGVPLYSDLTVKEFVSYMADLKLVSRKNKKEEVNKILEKTGLIEVQNKLTRNLSRGYKQRVSMAGALVGNPKIIILDEPTVGLDPKQVTEIREFIKSLRKDHTVILSSHILSEVSQICEKVIIINEGQILAVDTPSNLEDNVNETNKLVVSVDDINAKFEEVVKEIPEVKRIGLMSSNDDSKKYVVEYDKNSDIRKELFSTCAKENIIILEMKKEEISLEDAFIKIVDEGNSENNTTSSDVKNEIEDDNVVDASKDNVETQNDKDDKEESSSDTVETQDDKEDNAEESSSDTVEMQDDKEDNVQLSFVEDISEKNNKEERQENKEDKKINTEPVIENGTQIEITETSIEEKEEKNEGGNK